MDIGDATRGRPAILRTRMSVMVTNRDPAELLWPWIAETGDRARLLDWFSTADLSAPEIQERLRHLTARDRLFAHGGSFVGPTSQETGRWRYRGRSLRGFARWWAAWRKRAAGIRATVTEALSDDGLRRSKRFLEAIGDLEDLLIDARYGFRRSAGNDPVWPFERQVIAPNLATVLALALSEELMSTRRVFRCQACGEWAIQATVRGPRRKSCSAACAAKAHNAQKRQWQREHPEKPEDVRARVRKSRALKAGC